MQENAILHVPPYIQKELDGLYLFIDPEGPNWLSTDFRGAKIIGLIDGKKTFDEIVRLYSKYLSISTAKAWVHVDSFINEAIREKFVSHTPFTRAPYNGRIEHVYMDNLEELWIHTNNSCNLQCTHCLVSSGPWENKGLSTEEIKNIVDQGRELGVFRFYFTGGEPFIRKDIYKLIEYVTQDPDSELIVLTNGMLFNQERNIKQLLEVARGRLKPQISLDGSTPDINDVIRGKGTFEKIVNGIKTAVDWGLNPTVTTVVTSENAHDVPNITRLLSSLGIQRHHLLWVHQRGRAVEGEKDILVPVHSLIEVVKKVKNTADQVGVIIDNFESVKAKLKAKKFTKFDLSNACWKSLCVYSDGQVYPSAALANFYGLGCGNIKEKPLVEIWQESSICNTFRRATVQKKTKCSSCHLKFICGGGDIEHSYFYSAATYGKGDVHGQDPYCELHEYMVISTLFELAEENRKRLSKKSGFDAPLVFTSMGDDATSCGTHGSNGRAKPPSDFNVELSHSNCVLTFKLDRTREAVREFYGKAAENPQKELCCPTGYPEEDTSHIPQDVIERFYGCGSPIGMAGIKQGETVVDLGSGAGIDCFIAAKKVGPSGKVIGVDMTEQMLGVARKCKPKVAANLGYDVVEFRKGFLEDIPVEDSSANLITSNCVINLSPDKKKVFSEMWRILKDHGRIVVSDIVSESEVPPHITTNEKLWGECIAGALTEEQFISYLEQAGFYGIEILQKRFWKTIENYSFFSITVKGYKFEKKAGCVFRGQKAIYLGPFKAVIDEEGHLFPRGEEVEICTDTAEKLSTAPYKGMFSVLEPDTEENQVSGTGCCNTSYCC